MDIHDEFDKLKKKVTPINTIKFIGGTVISCGAMAAIVAALKSPVQSAKGLTKWMMRLGIFVLGCKAGDEAEKYFTKTIDEMLEGLKEVQKEEKDGTN